MTLECPYCDDQFPSGQRGRQDRVQHLYVEHDDEFGTAGTWLRALEEVDS